MPMRAVWRPPWYAWVLTGLTALLLTYKVAPDRFSGRWMILTPILVVAGVAGIRKLWDVNPAITACAAIVLTVFSGAWRQIGLGGLPFNRLLVVIVLLQILLRAPGTAHTPRLQLRNVHLLMGLAIVYVLASAALAGTLTTENGYLTVVDMFGVAPFLMFMVTPVIFSGRRERDILLATLVGLGAYLGFTAIFESLGPHGLIFPRYIARVDVELPGGRAGGPFQSSVDEGFATYACAVAAAMAFTQWHDQRKRWFAAIVAVVCTVGCFVTLERGVWIAAVAATIVAALTTRAGRRWLVPGAGLCAVVIAGALAFSPSLANKTSARTGAELSVWSRQNQTNAGLRMVAAKPLFGFGWDSYTAHSLEYFRQASTYPQVGYVLDEAIIAGHTPPLPLHDTYLSIAVELGLIGGLLWLASLLWGVGEGIFGRRSTDLRPWKRGLLAIAVFYLVVALFDPREQAFPLMLLWCWAGVAFGSEPLSAQARRAKSAFRPNGSILGIGRTTSDLVLGESRQ